MIDKDDFTRIMGIFRPATSDETLVDIGVFEDDGKKPAYESHVGLLMREDYLGLGACARAAEILKQSVLESTEPKPDIAI